MKVVLLLPTNASNLNNTFAEKLECVNITTCKRIQRKYTRSTGIFRKIFGHVYGQKLTAIS